MNDVPKVIEFRDVHRAYRRGEDVLDGVSFSVSPGQVVGLLGRNGAGKTTLIRIAMGMIEAQRGSVRVLELDPRRHPVEVKRRVGYVSEEQILPEFLRVGDVIEIHRNLFPSWDTRLEEKLLERFGLPRRPRVKSLSKGQARQLALLCAVAHRPELLLLDEPAGGLDPAARREFLETSIQLLNDAGSTILFSSHHMTDVERMADRIVMIDGGKVLIDSDLDALRERHSLAMIPRGSGVFADALDDLEDCLGVRERGDSLHAVFRLDPGETARRLRGTLGIDGIRCVPVALEEMFVELLGSRR